MDRSFDAQLGALRDAGTNSRLWDGKQVQAFKTAANYQKVQAGWGKAQESQGVRGIDSVVKKVNTILEEAMK